MDNQNANEGGIPQSPNQPQNNQQQPVPGPSHTYENVRTQSVIETSREVAEKELAAQEAYNEQVLRSQQAAIRREKGAHVAMKVMLVVFGLIILVALGWLIVEIVKSMQGPVSDGCRDSEGKIMESCCDKAEYKNYAECRGAAKKLSTIDGYKCLTDKCKKMTDIIKDEQIVIYDTKFYIYDIKKGTSRLMTIDDTIEYNKMTSFEWGAGKYYVVLYPMTGNLGLYSVSSNAQIIPNTVSYFYSDIKHNAYKDMTDVLGKYIIVRESNQYRLYDASDGNKIASGTEGVYVYQKYAMSIDGGGTRRILNLSGKEIFVAKENEDIFIRDGYVFLTGKTLAGYDEAGNKLSVTKNATLREINSVSSSKRSAYLKDPKNKFYMMPTTRNYSDK